MQTSSENLACRACGEKKPQADFRRHNRGGRRRMCRQCENAQARKVAKHATPEKRAYQRQRRAQVRGFSLAMDARRRSLTKGLVWSLDWRDIQTRIEAGVCEATGLPFSLTEPIGWNAPSLDQIVPGAGYTPSNTRVVLYAFNMMVGTWGEDVMMQIALAYQQKVK